MPPLAPIASMRNVLVHGYLDVDRSMVAAAIPLALDGYERYRRAVARWLDQAER